MQNLKILQAALDEVSDGALKNARKLLIRLHPHKNIKTIIGMIDREAPNEDIRALIKQLILETIFRED